MAERTEEGGEGLAIGQGLDALEENERWRTRGSAGGQSKWMRVATGAPEFGEGERRWWEKGIERSEEENERWS